MKTSRLDTRLESEAAEFLVLGNLLLERIVAYKTYTNMPGYDLVATDPERNTSAKIQVKSRWRTNAPGFPIKNFNCDFVVFVRLNRGTKKGTGVVRSPDFYVFPVALVHSVWPPEDPWGKVRVSQIEGWESYLNRWDLIRNFLAPDQSTDSATGTLVSGTDAASGLAPRTRGSKAGIGITEFRRLITRIDGQRLETGKQHRGFVVRVLEKGLEITPDSSGQPRRVRWERIAQVLQRYKEIGSPYPRDYHDITYHSSYLLSILRQVLT